MFCTTNGRFFYRLQMLEGATRDLKRICKKVPENHTLKQILLEPDFKQRQESVLKLRDLQSELWSTSADFQIALQFLDMHVQDVLEPVGDNDSDVNSPERKRRERRERNS